jgi:pilus assembly protein CpaB
MSSTLRLSIIMVLLLAAGALGLIAYNNMKVPAAISVIQVTQATPAPPSTGYFAAARPLPVGTLARDEDFEVRSVPSGSIPSGAILDTSDARIGLRGSLVRQFLDTGSPVTAQDVLRPRDRGFLATVLAPNSRAVSINVDAESGVSSLIRPGDYVDVVLTQIDKEESIRAVSEIIIRKVRIIAIDQEIVQGGAANNATAGKPLHPVSLELAPEQVKKIAVAKHIGTLSLAVRAAVEEADQEDTGTVLSRDVSPEIARKSEQSARDSAELARKTACESAIARQSATVEVYVGEKVKKYLLNKHDIADARTMFPCNGSPEIVLQSATAAGYAGVKVPEKQ